MASKIAQSAGFCAAFAVTLALLLAVARGDGVTELLHAGGGPAAAEAPARTSFAVDGSSAFDRNSALAWEAARHRAHAPAASRAVPQWQALMAPGGLPVPTWFVLDIR